MIKEPTKEDSLLDLILTEQLVGDVTAGDGPGYSGHKMGDFRILRGRSRAKSRITTLDVRRASSGTCLEEFPER